MSAAPQLKVYTASGEYIGSCKYPEDAAALVSVQGAGATVRMGHRKRDILWTEGVDGLAGDSYDIAGATIMERSAGGGI